MLQLLVPRVYVLENVEYGVGDVVVTLLVGKYGVCSSINYFRENFV